MSYNIKFDDITSVQVESQKTINAWGESVASLNKAMTDFINNQNLQGQAISSMRRYLVEVHGTLLQTLVNLMNDYSTNLLLYKDGYYQIDGDLHTKLPGQVFTNLHSALKSSRDNLKSEIELLNTTKDKISDLVSYEGSSHTSTVMDYNFLLNQIKNLDSSITQYESNHASQDLVAFKELLAATKALITEHAGKTRTVGTYQSGDFAKLKSVQRFAIAYKQATQQMESRVERVKSAQERDKVRFEALAAEDRAKNGWKEFGLGVLTVAIGILAIIGTMGSATPLVVGFGLTSGLGATIYGTSNAAEGVHNIVLGNAGDIQTKSYNHIRDTVFMGNDKLYHDVGNVFVTASAIMIPIGQTGSVVKGLTQFAIGEAGAYTAGQVAYHGTKLLGGSEEDAQTANFIGNIVGGYVTSSAASKFSLNKVKVDIPSTKSSHLDVPLQGKQIPKLDPDSVRLSSRKDLHLKASTADMSLAKLKSHPPVSMDVPKVKGIYKSGKTSVPKDLDVPSGTTSRKAHVEDVEHYTTWDQMKSEHYRTVTEFVQDNKPEGAPHPREWLSKPNHEFKIEHMSDGTQVWRYTDDIGVEKVYIDGVLQGGGIPNPKVTQHFEQLNPKIKDFDPDVASTLQKSNAGEILADDNMRIVRENVGANGNTYTLESIGRPAPSGIDDPIVKGIDGIYKNQTPPPSYVINETKWGSSKINQHTKSGPQMSQNWVRDRLGNLDPMEQISIERALETGDVDFVISKVDETGNISTYRAIETIDSTGNVIGVKPDGVWP